MRSPDDSSAALDFHGNFSRTRAKTASLAPSRARPTTAGGRKSSPAARRTHARGTKRWAPTVIRSRKAGDHDGAGRRSRAAQRRLDHFARRRGRSPVELDLGRSPRPPGTRSGSVPGAQRLHGHARSLELGGHRLRQREDEGLAGRVDGQERHGLERGRGDDVDAPRPAAARSCAGTKRAGQLDHAPARSSRSSRAGRSGGCSGKRPVWPTPALLTSRSTPIPRASSVRCSDAAGVRAREVQGHGQRRRPRRPARAARRREPVGAARHQHQPLARARAGRGQRPRRCRWRRRSRGRAALPRLRPPASVRGAIADAFGQLAAAAGAAAHGTRARGARAGLRARASCRRVATRCTQLIVQ